MEQVNAKTISLWVIASVALLFLALLGSGAWFYHAEEASAGQKAEQQLSSIGRLKLDQIAAWRRERLSDAASIAGNPDLAENVRNFLAAANEVDTSELSARLRNIQTHCQCADVLIVDAAGQMRLSLTGTGTPSDAHGPAVAAALHDQKAVLSDLYTTPQHPTPYISVIVPLFTGEQQPLPSPGAIILVIDAAQFLDPLLTSWSKPSRTTETLLVRRDQETVLFLSGLLHHPDAAMKLRIPLSRTETIAVMAVQGREGYVEGLDYRGIESLAVVLPVPGFSWLLITKDDAAEVFGVWRFRAALLMILFAVLACVAGTLGLIIRQYNQKAYYQALYLAEARLRASVEGHSITLKAVGDGIITTDARGRIELLNPVAERLTGWRHEEACGRPLDEVFCIVNEETREKVENPVDKVIREGVVVGLANHTLLIAKNGIGRAIADSAAPIRNEQGEIFGVVLVFRDQSDERRTQRMIQARITLQEYAFSHSFDEFLTKTIDDICSLLASPVGFYHFVNADQKTLSKQHWSTSIKEVLGNPGVLEAYNSFDQIELWADSIRQRRPVLYNDAASLPHGEQRPREEAAVLRELVVPVIKAGKVVAILGVCNKPESYTDRDIEIVSYLSDVSWRIVEYKWTEKQLCSSERRYRTLYQSLMDAFVVTDMQGRIIECNDSYSSMLGYTNAELKQLRCSDVTPKKWLSYEKDVVRKQVLHYGSSKLYEKEYRRKDGTVFPVELRTFLIINDENVPEGFSAIVRDISERRTLEAEQVKLRAQLHQMQKMEAIGTLAGGIAHDFNNILGAIIGFAEIAKNSLAPESQVAIKSLDKVLNASHRAATLVKQILAFSRQEKIELNPVQPGYIVKEAIKLLRPSLPTTIEIRPQIETATKPILADPTQLHQILINLCTNAFHAMEHTGGILEVTLKDCELSADDLQKHPEIPPGRFVELTVSDTGTGIESDISDKIFDPYFTTKEFGKGTGMGLAIVHGIVTSYGGYITTESNRGSGAIFRVFLPAIEQEVRPADESVDFAPLGTERILFVDDEEGLVAMGKVLLGQLGYKVTGHASSLEALSVFKNQPDMFDAVITDMTMPEMTGIDLAKALLQLRPDLPVILCSGYSALISEEQVQAAGIKGFITKPYTQMEIALILRKVLDPQDAHAETDLQNTLSSLAQKGLPFSMPS